MRRVRKFLQLSLADKLLLIRVALLLSAVRVGLHILPLPVLRRRLAGLMHRRYDRPADDFQLRRITTAIEVVSRPVNDTMTCLTRALVGQLLLTRSGYPVELRIGVARGAGGKLESHAWIECEGRVLIGAQPDMSRYKLMPSWEGKSI